MWNHALILLPLNMPSSQLRKGTSQLEKADGVVPAKEDKLASYLKRFIKKRIYKDRKGKYRRKKC
jgi:hypothetical protein